MTSIVIEFPCYTTVRANHAEYNISCTAIVQTTMTIPFASEFFVAILNENGQPIVPATYKIINGTHDVLNYITLQDVGLPPWMRGVISPTSNLQRFFSSFQYLVNSLSSDTRNLINSYFVDTAQGSLDYMGVVDGNFISIDVNSAMIGNTHLYRSRDILEFMDDTTPLPTYYILDNNSMIIRFNDIMSESITINGRLHTIHIQKITDDLDRWGFILDLRRHVNESDGSYKYRLNYEFGITDYLGSSITRYANSTNMGLRFQIARFTGAPYEDIKVESLIDYINNFVNQYNSIDRQVLSQIKSNNGWGQFYYSRSMWLEDSDLNNMSLIINYVTDGGSYV